MYNTMISRNIGVLSKKEQNKIKNSSIGIAGLGGIGGLLAERLIRIGVGKIKLTDPGKFELSNFNRQYASNYRTLKKNKAEVVAKELSQINREASIIYDKKGIQSQEDADLFAAGVDIVVDELDYGLFLENIYLQRAARRRKIYYVFSAALGFGSLVAIFNPTGITLEEYNGFSKETDITKVRLSPGQLAPHYPTYMKGKEHIVAGILKGKTSVSSNSIGAGLASIITANEIINLILKKVPICEAPKSIYIDLMDKVLK